MNGYTLITSYTYPSNTSTSSSTIKRNGAISKWQGYKCKLGKFLWEEVSKLIILALVAQISTIQAAVSNVPRIGLQNQCNVEILTEPKDYTNKTKIMLPNNTCIDTEFNPYIEISQESEQKILHQFYKIDDNLQELIKRFSADKNDELLGLKSAKTILTRIVRSFPYAQRQECTATKDGLIELKNTISDALSNVTATPKDSNCEFNTDSNTDNCEKLLKLLQCGVNHLKNGYLKATANKASLDEVTKWKNAYNNLQENFQKGFDNVRRSVSQQYQQQLDTLKTELQYLGKQLNKALHDLQEKIIRLCISEISSGKTANAVSLYLVHFLKDESKLSEIIRTAYIEYGNINNVNNIVDFIKSLPNCKLDKIAYPVLFDLMKANNHLNSPEVLIFSNAVGQCMSSSSLENELKIRTNDIIDTWAYKIRNDDYEQFIEIVEKNCGHFLDDYWSQIIEKGYAKNLANAENILKFIRSLPCINNTARALTALFNEMKNNNHLDSYQLLMLAYKIKHELDYVNNNPNFQYGTGGHQYYEDTYINLKNSLPSSIMSLIWNGNQCIIKNAHWNEYLYASSIRDHDTRRKVFTWIPGETVIQGYWKFTPIDHAKRFTIKNTVHNEYLYASSLEDHVTRRKAFTWIPGGTVIQSYWILTPENNADHFIMKNTNYNEYLYASSIEDHKTRRKVFTWIPGISVRESDWKISCSS